MRDLKPVYQAATKEAAESALDALEAKWVPSIRSLSHPGNVNGKT